MRDISIDRLRTFVTVAELGSFAAAARTLHLAPPTVSLHVSHLERRFDTALLFRERSKVMPTGTGAVLLEHARRVLNELDTMAEQLQLHVQGQIGRVRLGASTPVVVHLLPAMLDRLRQQTPGIDIRIRITTSHEAMTQVAEGALDIGIAALPQPAMPHVAIEPWRRDPVVALIPAAWSPPAVVTPAWLAKRPLIMNDERTHLSRMTKQWFANAGHSIQPKIQHNYNDAIESLVEAEYGAALLANVRRENPYGERICMASLRPALWRPLGIVYRNYHLERPIQRILDFLFAMRAL